MIRKANVSDLSLVASMLYAMYMELMPDVCSNRLSDYTDEALKYLIEHDVLIDDKARGMFVVKDVYNPLTPSVKQWFGLVVYIKPEFRKTRVLKTFYDYLFENYKGNILGLTEINSEHIKVLDKRHTCTAKMYILNN